MKHLTRAQTMRRLAKGFWSPIDSAKFIYKTGCKPPVYGNYINIHEFRQDLIDSAKDALYRQSYLPLKAALRKHGICLSEPTWIIRKHYECFLWYDPTGSVGYKATADNPITNEAYRRMTIARKRMRRAKL